MCIRDSPSTSKTTSLEKAATSGTTASNPKAPEPKCLLHEVLGKSTPKKILQPLEASSPLKKKPHEQSDSSSFMDVMAMDPEPMEMSGSKHNRESAPQSVSPELLAPPLLKPSLSFAEAAASQTQPMLDPSSSTSQPTRKQLLAILKSSNK